MQEIVWFLLRLGLLPLLRGYGECAYILISKDLPVWQVSFDVLCGWCVCVYRCLGLLDGYTGTGGAGCVYASVALGAGLISETAYSR